MVAASTESSMPDAAWAGLSGDLRVLGLVATFLDRINTSVCRGEALDDETVAALPLAVASTRMSALRLAAAISDVRVLLTVVSSALRAGLVVEGSDNIAELPAGILTSRPAGRPGIRRLVFMEDP